MVNVALTAVNGVVDVAALRLDSQLRGAFQFIGNQVGPARVTATTVPASPHRRWQPSRGRAR